MKRTSNTGSTGLMTVTGDSRWSGLSNLLHKELRDWFSGITPLWTSLIWIGMINGIMLLVLITERKSGSEPLRLAALAVDTYSQFVAMFASVGVVIAALDAIIAERELGTLAFTLSKPLSRASFVLAKFVSNAIGIFVTSVLIPGIVAYIQTWVIAGTRLPMARFGIGMVISTVGLLFYLALCLFLSAVFRHKGPVVAISLILIFEQQFFLSLIPQLMYVMPWSLPDLVKAYVLDSSLTSPAPLIAVPFMIALLLAATVAVFCHEDI